MTGPTGSFSPEGLSRALRAVGLGAGDVVYLHSQLFALGTMVGVSDRETFLDGVLSAFLDVIGGEGTLVVPTFTTTAARAGLPFVLEETACDTGMFAEYLRTRPGVERSLHPINSVAAIGQAVAAVCRDVSRGNYGADTPFDRMLRLDAKAVNLGFSSRFSNSWHHQAEAALGLPYLYNKLLDMEVWACGQQVKGPFHATLRYLDFGIANDLSRFDRILVEDGHLARASIGRSLVTCISATSYYRLALDKLKADPWYMLARSPAFRRGEIPWDGAPGQRAT